MILIKKNVENKSNIILNTGLFIGVLVTSYLILILGFLLKFTISYVDSGILEYFNNTRSSFLTSFFLWISVFGEVQTAILIILFITCLMLLWRKTYYMIFMWVFLAGSGLIPYFLKMVFQNPRPLGFYVYKLGDYSFPSAHASFGLALALFVIYFVYHTFNKRRVFVLSSVLMVFFALLMGGARIYLGVHYLSDVIAGYFLAIVWFFSVVILFEKVYLKKLQIGLSNDLLLNYTFLQKIIGTIFLLIWFVVCYVYVGLNWTHYL